MRFTSESETPDVPKPDDLWEFAFAPVCDLDHVTGFGEDSITIKQLTEVLICCKQCGRPARYTTIKRISEAQWEQYPNLCFNPPGKENPTKYWWAQRYFSSSGSTIRWTKAERVRSITL